ncbi:hypothetical protein CDAR_414731 [Caerostris darwini]|uniref:Uncharacterized protein n=1 Tax=Caerostris darwini TaxID=1538125 RepID=A0AAV4RFD2_9ARAC|nr:hypothetical protein CDAR_414731 [Caerostris darwini]
MRGVQVQLCKTEDAVWVTWIVRKMLMDVDFTIPPSIRAPLPILLRYTNEELGGRFWRSMPQDVLIHRWKTLFLHVVEVRPHSRPLICNIFVRSILLMIWLRNRDEDRRGGMARSLLTLFEEM